MIMLCRPKEIKASSSGASSREAVTSRRMKEFKARIPASLQQRNVVLMVVGGSSALVSFMVLLQYWFFQSKKPALPPSTTAKKHKDSQTQSQESDRNYAT